MKRKRIVIVTSVPETLATILSGQPKYLHKYYDVFIVCSNGKYAEIVKEREGVPVHFVDMYRGISPLKDLISIVRMICYLRKIRPDIVHSYTPKAGLVAMVASWVSNVPIRIHTFTGLVFPVLKGVKRKIIISADRLVAKLATNIVPESNGVLRDLLKYKITSKNMSVIGYGNIAGVDVDFFKPSNEGRKQNFWAGLLENYKEGFVFCFVGRINRDKGIRELVCAFNKLDDNCYLVIVGDLDVSLPPDNDTLELIRSNPRISMLGFQEDIRAFLREADVFVLPSYREGFPNVVLQSLAMECPAIVTNVSGSNEIVSQGICGWVVQPNDVASLYQAMSEASYTAKNTLEKMGKAGRLRVIQRHERNMYLEKLRSFYDGVL